MKASFPTALNGRIAIRLWYNCCYTIAVTVLLWYIIICKGVMPNQKCFPQIVFAAITEQEQTHCCHVHIHICYTISA